MLVTPCSDILTSHLFTSLVAAIRNYDYSVVGSEFYTTSPAKNLIFQLKCLCTHWCYSCIFIVKCLTELLGTANSC